MATKPEGIIVLTKPTVDFKFTIPNGTTLAHAARATAATAPTSGSWDIEEDEFSLTLQYTHSSDVAESFDYFFHKATLAGMYTGDPRNFGYGDIGLNFNLTKIENPDII